MMKKNDEYIITIEDIGNDGEGIGHLPLTDETEHGGCTGRGEADRGIAVFVKDAVVGDVVRIGLTKVKKTYAYARVIALIEPSPFRVEPRCANAGRCGGCSLMHMSYEKQLEYKWNKVKNCLERIGGIADAETYMEPVCGMETPFFYRNKMQFPVGVNKEGKVEIGFYAGRTHSIIDMDRCVIGHPVNDSIIRELRTIIQTEQDKTGKFVYDEQTHTGVLRHILTRVGFVTGELMVCFVINETKLPCGEKVVLEALERAVYSYNSAKQSGKYRKETNCRAIEKDVKLTSVSININCENTNRILGDTCKTLWGSDTITDYIGDVCFSISPMSFYQVNPVQTKRLYDKAIEYAQLTGNEVVWDMYCGIGTISLSIARHAKKVYGVEIVPQAIEDAKKNALKNGFANAQFFCGKAEEVVPQFYNNNRNDEESLGCHPDVVIVDPPRKGCDSILLDTIKQMSPKRLVYVSCDPATLARDIKLLSAHGFSLAKVCVVDQFSHSNHVETVALLLGT